MENFSGIKLTSLVFQTLLYLIGLPIQVKIIKICWREKDGKTWYIHLINSVILIIHFFLLILYDIITHFFPNLSSITGEWLCYGILFVRFYGYFIIIFNSLLVALIKYTYIVHNKNAMLNNEAKLKKLFLAINFFLPFSLAALASVTKDINVFSDLVSCFGLTQEVDETYDTWYKNVLKFFMCSHGWTEHDITEKYSLYILQQCACGFKTVFAMLISSNVPEAFLYFRIFSKMNR